MRLERTREFITRWGRNRDDHDHMCAVEIRELWGDPSVGPPAVCDCGLADTDAAFAELDQAEAVIKAARVRTEGGHADTCGLSLGVYPCSCGQEALASALAAFGSGEVTG